MHRDDEPIAAQSIASAPPSAAPARVILPLVAAGLILGGLVLSANRGDSETVSSLTRRIQDIALAGTDPAAKLGDNHLGPWRLAVRSIDPVSGEFIDFRVESGQMVIAAKTAMLIVDAERDSFTFELSDVTYTRIPGDKDTDTGFIDRMERYTLGPVKLGLNITGDGGSDGTRDDSPAATWDDDGLVIVDDFAVQPE